MIRWSDAQIDRRGLRRRRRAVAGPAATDKPPNSLFDNAGYHVRGDKVYYLARFPGKAFRDRGCRRRLLRGVRPDVCPRQVGACTSTAGRCRAPMRPPSNCSTGPGFFKDRDHVYQRDHPISDDPAHFELLDGELAKDSTAVYWSDGSVLSEDPAALRDHLRMSTTTCSPRTVARFTSTATRSPVPTPRRSACCRAHTPKMPGASSISPSRSSTPTRRRSARSRAHTPAMPARVYWMGKPIDGARPGDLPCAERRLRMLGRRAARVLPGHRHRQCGSGRFRPAGRSPDVTKRRSRSRTSRFALSTGSCRSSSMSNSRGQDREPRAAWPGSVPSAVWGCD